MKQVLVIILSIGFSISAIAQENAPTISGKVKISIVEGTFDCDLYPK